MDDQTINQSAPDPGGALEPPIEFQWGPNAPRGAKAVFARIIKEGANVPLFLGQTLVNALRDLGYNDTTSAVCEFVDNAVQWGAQEVRVYFHESGGKRGGRKRIDVAVVDNGAGMAPNVLRAATAFGGSMCFDSRKGIGRYGVGMKGAALSMGRVLEIFSWQEPAAFYNMTLDINDVGEDRSNVVNVPTPEFGNQLPHELMTLLTTQLIAPREGQELLATSREGLMAALGRSGTIIYVPDCDRLTYRTAKSLTEQATREMARVYRRQLAAGVRLFVNNRRVEPFDPTYQMSAARHTKVEGIRETSSRLVNKWDIEVPIEEGDGGPTATVKVRLFRLPIEDWDQLTRKVQKNDLHVFDPVQISFMRSDREVHAGEMRALSGKHWTGDAWWRIEIEFPPELDETFGVAVNKQGVRLKNYVVEMIRTHIHEDLRQVKDSIEKHYGRRAAEDGRRKGVSEAERRANEAEALQTTLLPQEQARNQEERLALENNLRALAGAYKREDETDEAAFERIRDSRYITTFKYDEDAPFYRVDFKFGKVILTVNSGHPFFKQLYEPLTAAARRPIEPARDDDGDPAGNPFAEALVTLELLLLSLARTQSMMLINDTSGDLRRSLDQMRKQWSLDLATLLTVR